MMTDRLMSEVGVRSGLGVGKHVFLLLPPAHYYLPPFSTNERTHELGH